MSNYCCFFFEDIDEEVSTVVDMTVQINFKRLMTMFNIIIVCSAAALHHVQMKMASAGAGQIQTVFIAKRKHVPNSKGKYHITLFSLFFFQTLNYCIL